MRWAGLFLCGALTGCRFDLPVPGDVPPDARLCFGSGLAGLCLPSAPTMPRTLSGTLDTGIDTMCDHIVNVTGLESCVIAGTTIDIASGASVRAIGLRPLVLVASGSLMVAGELDAGSKYGGPAGAGALDTPCPGLGTAERDEGGGGGAAGGSLFGSGGRGGTGDTDDSGPPTGSAAGSTAAAAFVPTGFRAGCRGGRGGLGASGSTIGIPGLGGGGVYLIAGTLIQISGVVTAYGAGGGGGDGGAPGGGGGGSGGMIGLDAPAVAVTASGHVTANGGGGGEGGSYGNNGSDGTNTADRAAGGGGLTSSGGDGGAGSGGVVSSGGAGENAIGGGGGGGGGAGFIYVKGALTSNGVISPAAQLY